MLNSKALPLLRDVGEIPVIKVYLFAAAELGGASHKLIIYGIQETTYGRGMVNVCRLLT